MEYIRATDGVKLAVYEYNPNAKEAVFMVHGWPLSHLMYEYQVEFLLNHGYRVITVDLRGFGNSGAPAGSYSFDQMASDLHSVVRAKN